MTYVFLNDRPVPAREAVVSVQDRGFRYGDGLFETIRVHQGAPYRFDAHIARLKAGLAAIGIAHDLAQIGAHCAALLAQNAVREGLLRIAVSRGMGGRGYLPEADCVPTLVIETMDLPTPPAQPVSLWLSAYAKIPAQCLPVQHKLAQGLSSTLARAEAAAQGCFDALMLTTQGHISETSSGNIFWLEGDTLHTPSLACDALDGITRRFILEHAPMEVREDVYSTTDIARAEAVIICNTAWNILPVRNLLPGSTKWRSESLAQTLNSLLMKDIADHAAKALAR